MVEATHRFDLERGYLTDFLAEGAYLGDRAMRHAESVRDAGRVVVAARSWPRWSSVQDPQGLSRVQVQLLGPDADDDAPIWARVAVPFAGDNYGAFLIPDVDEEVLVLLIAGDARSAVVVGALWNGATGIPETIGGRTSIAGR